MPWIVDDGGSLDLMDGSLNTGCALPIGLSTLGVAVGESVGLLSSYAIAEEQGNAHISINDASVSSLESLLRVVARYGLEHKQEVRHL